MTTGGRCLCGQVSYEIRGKLPNIYRCYCSLCRKVSGSASNAAMLVDADRFSWCSGQELISRFATDSGFQSHFCSGCGCPVPNPSRQGDLFWIPAGTLDADARSRVAAHVYVTSSAPWHEVGASAPGYETMPGQDEFLKLLESKE